MNGGFITLPRAIRSKWLWDAARPRTQFEAFLDLVMEARFGAEPVEQRIRGRIVSVGRGQVVRSVRGWANRWNWSRGKVERFLALLERHGLILYESVGPVSQLSIVDFDSYSPRRDNTETVSETETGQKARQLNSAQAKSYERRRDNCEPVGETLPGRIKKTTNENEKKKKESREEFTRLGMPSVDFQQLLQNAERFWSRLKESFAPLDRRNEKAFMNLRHQMYEYARTVSPDIWLEGISAIRRAEEQPHIRNRAAWVTRTIKNTMAQGRAACAAKG